MSRLLFVLALLVLPCCGEEKPKIILENPKTTPYKAISSTIRIVAQIMEIGDEKDVYVKLNQKTLSVIPKKLVSEDKVLYAWDIDLEKGVNQLEIIALNSYGEASVHIDVEFQEPQKVEEQPTESNTKSPVENQTSETETKVETKSEKVIKSVKELQTLSGHKKSVLAIAFHPNSKILASASEDRTVKLWSLESYKEIANLIGHTNSVTAVTFSVDGKCLISAGHDSSIRIWNWQTGEVIKTIQVPSKIQTLAVSPDGKWYAAAGENQKIYIWSSETYQEHCVLSGHTTPIYSVCFSPNSQMLVSGSASGKLKLWSLETNKEIKEYSIHGKIVNQVVFPNKESIISCSNDNFIKLYNIEEGKEQTVVHKNAVFILCLDTTDDGNYFAFGTSEKTVEIWYLKSMQKVVLLTGHQDWIFTVGFSSDEKILATASSDGVIKLWELVD